MAASGRWSNLGQRINTAVILAAVSLFLIWWGNTPFLLEIAVFALAGSCEAFDMVERKKLRPMRRTGTLCTLLMLIGAWLGGLAGLAHATLISVLMLLVVATLRSTRRVSMILDAACTVLCVMYVGWLFSFMILLRSLPSGAGLVTLLIGLITMTDTGAYFIGRAFGRHKLCPALSPKKTIEGSLGGLLLSAWLGYKLCPMFGLPPLHGLTLAAGVSLFGQLGDIWESALKREVNLKDAGELLGGHGGVLDRFDSMAFAGPFFYLYWTYFV
ncbi:MAG: phosphatidate cytidylyltransferase [Candidatus Eremiobacteraeota bacterium]|nr:phosphatidate cytidylyltransferase [Candidatus Eremiobacteraeota bacterium]MCW5870650.1 phosphatidate cytidylyltransferase [Candidatus Eremiobacteraeota bacterium]